MSEQWKKSFVDEEIKEKPCSRKRLLLGLARTALHGFVFALAASVVFLIAGHLYSVIGLSRGGVAGNGSVGGETESRKQTETERKESDKRAASDKDKKKKKTSLDEYRTLRENLYKVGAGLKNSMVTVTGVVSNKDWFDDESEVSGQESGIVFRKKDGNYYILTNANGVQKAQKVNVTFEGGNTVEAEVAAVDSNTGLAVVGVKESGLTDITKKLISVAGFGDSDKVKDGDVVLAVGSLQGLNYSVQDGIVTMSGVRKTMVDSAFEVIATDIVCGEAASGVLVNLDGRIVGIASRRYGGDEQKNTLTAFATKTILPVIDKLAKGNRIPCLGLYVSTISSVVALEYNLPEGIYVKSVATGSPAMKAGIQNGDVVTAINGTEIRSVDEYQNMVYSLRKKEICEVTLKRMTGETYKEISCPVKVSVMK